jgi:hypothetical protein
MTKTLPSHVTFDRLTPDKIAILNERFYSLDALFAWLDADPRVEAYSRDDWALVYVVERPYMDMGSSEQPCIADDLRAAFPELFTDKFGNIVVLQQPGHYGSHTWRRTLWLYVAWKADVEYVSRAT